MPLTRIAGYGHVAIRYGLEESIFLESIMYWWRTNKANDRNYKDGHWWTYNTIKALAEVFPWWSAKQVRRIAASCREQGALIAGEYNEDGRDRTIWYRPSDELLVLYGEEVPPSESEETSEHDESICPNGQMQMPKRANSVAQMGEALPCIYHVDTNIPPYNPPKGDEEAGEKSSKGRKRREAKEYPDWRPERFEQFWNFYGMKVNRQRAIKEWDKLHPDDKLIDHMARTLKRQKRSDMWSRGIGIPHPAQWLKDRRWEDEDVSPPVAPVQSAGWAPDPEVTS